MGCGAVKAINVNAPGSPPPCGIYPPATDIPSPCMGTTSSIDAHPDRARASTPPCPANADPPDPAHQLPLCGRLPEDPGAHAPHVVTDARVDAGNYGDEPYLLSLADRGHGIGLLDGRSVPHENAMHARGGNARSAGLALENDWYTKPKEFDLRKNIRIKGNACHGGVEKREPEQESLTDRKLEFLFRELYREEQRERHNAAKHRRGHRTLRSHDEPGLLPVDFLNFSEYDVDLLNSSSLSGPTSDFDILTSEAEPRVIRRHSFDFPENFDDFCIETPRTPGAELLDPVDRWCLSDGKKEGEILRFQRQLEDSPHDSLSRKASLRELFEPDAQSSNLKPILTPLREDDGSDSGSGRQ
eukprot:GEMP01008302.1.p1 GENE.GEMP01008302.1~~GEMP01008302.1.p1  ORF type:complete len:357 (+),score=89.28 GEMP01008302.1:16-1086(+)